MEFTFNNREEMRAFIKALDYVNQVLGQSPRFFDFQSSVTDGYRVVVNTSAEAEEEGSEELSEDEFVG